MGKLVCILFTSLLTVGCWDATNLEHMYYANVLGIDYIDGQFEIYAQTVNFQAMAGGGETNANTGDSQAYVGRARGKTVTEAIHNLYQYTERRIYWGHLSAILLSERLLEKENELTQTIELITRYHEIRLALWVLATSSPLKEILTTPVILDLSSIFSIFGEPYESYEQSSSIAPIRMHKFVASINEPGQTTLLPIVRPVESLWFADKQKSHESIQVVGAAVLQGYQYKGVLLHKDMRGLHWIQKETVRTPVVYEHNGHSQGTVMLYYPKLNVISHTEGDAVYFDVELYVEGVLQEMERRIELTEVEKKIAQSIENDIRHTYLKGLELGADVLQLSHHLFKDHLKVWKDRTKDGTLSLHPDSLRKIMVHVKIKNSGKEKLK